ncbi:ATP-dependent helicase [Candidatus Pacearchaeota archaeon]|nr:ATP-dependent helicase [Candidatus Pacearchaeota archaeon]
MVDINNIFSIDNQLSKQTTITEQDKIIFKELSTFLAPYDDFQKKAIISNSPIIKCIAGAGTGKTTILTKRVEFLVKYKGVNSEKILAITFTRKARQEMQNRLLKNGIIANVETFNSFSEKFLQKYSHKIYGKQTKVLDYTHKQILFSLALQSLNITRETLIEEYFKDYQKSNKSKEELTFQLIDDCFFILDYFKSKNKRLEDFSVQTTSNNQTAKTLLMVCKQLENSLKLQGLRTYNDQLLDVIAFFTKNFLFIPKFEHILVDEYQDVNNQQIELLELLAPKNLFIVGDPRQSIYGWRGSNINYLLDFEKKYPQYETIILNKNYRSNKKIVDIINSLIKPFNLPDLKSIFPEEDSCFLYEFFSERDEFNFIIKKIKEYKDIFILARTNKQLQELSVLLKNKNIPYTIKKEDDISHYSGITLSTIHAIKGLESETVFIIGCNEQNFPCKYSENPVIDILKINDYDKEQEEKRLFYVAISRAKKNLFLTYSGKRHTNFINEEMIKILNMRSNTNNHQNQNI